MRNVDLLRSVDIFAQLSDEELLKIAGLLKEARVNRDATIFRQGEPGDALYLVSSGRVKATVADDAGGGERELESFSDGQFFGKMALVTGEPRSVTTQAATDARLLVLRKDDFDDFLAHNVHVMVQTMKVIAQLQAASSRRPAVERVAPSPRPPVERVAPNPQPAVERVVPNPQPAVEKVAPSPRPPVERVAPSAQPAVERVASDLHPPQEEAAEDPHPSGKVFTVFSPKGGVGKTTVAVNLAIALARAHPGSVALLDLSLTFGHTTLLLNLTPKSSLSAATAEVLRGMDPQGEMGYYLCTHPSSGLTVMAGATRPEEGETVTGEMAKVAIQQLRLRFPYVVVDTESYFSDPVLAALELSDRILILCSPEITSLRDVRECQRIFHEVVPIHRDRIVYLMNYIFPFKALSKEQFEGPLQQELFAELPYGGDGPARAALRGEAFLETQSGSPLGRSIQKLATRLASASDAHQERKRGFFR